jgi:sterol desaturase/sphingolipid hydroxylase (fatty acid hydroxylase superfamily)
MSTTGSTKKNLRIAEDIVFIGAFVFILYDLVTTYGLYMYRSIQGKGYLGALIEPFKTHQYYISAVSLIIIINTTLVLWEVFSFVVQLLGEERKRGHHTKIRYRLIFQKVAVHYKSSFLAMLVGQLLPKVVIVHMFWVWLPHFQWLRPFTVDLAWYSWIYGYLCWEFAAWIFHYTSHRVRLLWCFHSPHHGASEINMTVNWIHFFAESYYSTLVRLIVLTMFGVNPEMFGVVIAIDSAWGIFIHVSERVLTDGRLGFIQYVLITPAHHRVHHAKNHLYLDTNFANVLPIWDWLFGTLQPIKAEVRAEYGLLRDLDATNFSDLYLGELLLLYSDVKNAKGIRNKLLYLYRPPGWTPDTSGQTAPILRQAFAAAHPGIAQTSRDRLLGWLRSRFGNEQTPSQTIEVPAVPAAAEIN